MDDDVKETQLFTVSGEFTKQYGLMQDADAEDEATAQELLIEKAKADGMVEWCFLAKRSEYNLETGKRLAVFTMLANPVFTVQNADASI